VLNNNFYVSLQFLINDAEMDTDKQTVSGILLNDEQVVLHFFFEECKPMFRYIIRKIFNDQIEEEELINELYIHLKENEWHNLQQFDYTYKLKTWTAIVATRLFMKKRAKLIKNPSSAHLITEQTAENNDRFAAHNVENLLSELKNERYRFVVRELVLEDREPKEVATELGITIENLYKIKQRALVKLAQILKKDIKYMDYYKKI